MRRDLSAADPFALGAAIRSRGVSPPTLVLITRLGTELPEAELRAAGFAGQLTAPVRQSQLVPTIAAALAGEAALPKLRPNRRPLTPLPAMLRRPPSTGRILVAEDNEINQIVVAEMLTGVGYSCEIASNGRQAVEMIARGAYDLVLMDCQMPEMDGFEATRAIRLAEQSSPAARRTADRRPDGQRRERRSRTVPGGRNGYLPDQAGQSAAVGRVHSHDPQPIDCRGRQSRQREPADAPTPESPAAASGLVPPIDRGGPFRNLGRRRRLDLRAGGKVRADPGCRVGQDEHRLRTGDLKQVARSAHTLKGTAAYMAARPIAARRPRWSFARMLFCDESIRISWPACGRKSTAVSNSCQSSRNNWPRQLAV